MPDLLLVPLCALLWCCLRLLTCCAFALVSCVCILSVTGSWNWSLWWISTCVRPVNCFLLYFLWWTLKLGVDLSQLFLTLSLCCESCKVEVTHVNIYLITTHELCRALSSLWGRHDLHYNDTVDIFPVTLIVTSLLPVGICGLIRQLVQAIWSCDETRQEGRGWDLRGKKRERGKKGGFMEYQSIQTIYECELISSSPPCIHLPACGLTNNLHPYLPLTFLLLVAVVLPAIGTQASWAVKPTREGAPGALLPLCKPLASKAVSGSPYLSWG